VGWKPKENCITEAALLSTVIFQSGYKWIGRGYFQNAAVKLQDEL
jgi:hypothetical protein